MFPSRSDGYAFWLRVLAGDPVVSLDVHEAYLDPLLYVLRHDLDCQGDDAIDSAVDAVLYFLQNPARYDPQEADLGAYLAGIAKNKAKDRRRSARSRVLREKDYAEVVALGGADPKESMERSVEAREAWKLVCKALDDERDQAALGLMLKGERSTAKLAEPLGFRSLPLVEQRGEVKRARDRISKVLARLFGKGPDDDEQT